ncbi:MAG: CheF family chemotaxis protein [Methanomicrobiaceae archaeon]|nr:CheF family chemotaxis protein [Methanomicrobiaceae archaeon]
MKSVPIKIEWNGSWIKTRMGIAEDRIAIAAPVDCEIPYRSVVDLFENKSQIVITTAGESACIYRIASVDKVLEVLKRFIVTNCSAYRLNAFFMSPAIRGGVLVKDARWEKGVIAVLRTAIWFASPETQVCIPLDEVAKIELTSREIQGKDLNVVKLDHLIENEVITSFVLCPLTTLQVLYTFLQEATSDLEMGGDDLDPIAAQVAMLVYSGMDSHAIENMLSLSQKELDAIYERLLSLGLAEVLCIRKEIQITAKGVRYINDSLKT